MDDTISRQAAIDEIKEIYEWHDNVTKERIIEHFVRLPSAQPEKRTEKRTETHAYDLIDREAAVDAIYHHLPSVSRTRARTMLHEVPSARPELRRGDES